MVHKKDLIKSIIRTVIDFSYIIMLIFILLFGSMLFYWGLFKLESYVETIGLIIVVIIFFLIIWKGNYDNINHHL